MNGENPFLYLGAKDTRTFPIKLSQSFFVVVISNSSQSKTSKAWASQLYHQFTNPVSCHSCQTNLCIRRNINGATKARTPFTINPSSSFAAFENPAEAIEILRTNSTKQLYKTLYYSIFENGYVMEMKLYYVYRSKRCQTITATTSYSRMRDTNGTQHLLQGTSIFVSATLGEPTQFSEKIMSLLAIFLRDTN